MVFTLPEGAFLPLKLMETDKQALTQQAQQAVQVAIMSSNEFSARGIPDQKLWRLVKAKESFRIYRERQSKAEIEEKRSHSAEPELPEFVDRTSRFFSSWSTTTDTVDSLPATDFLPAVVGLGTIDGTLGDVMYGSLASDDETWRLKSTYVNDSIEDAKVLATIYGPASDDPYRYLGIKWFTFELPIGVGAVMQRRDFVIVEATGLTQDSAGNQVGYCLYHSIEFPEVPELKSMKIVRGYTSICFVYRTVTPSVVSVFCRGFLDSGGWAPVSVCALLMADSLLATLNIMECAYMKKLMWTVKQKRREQLEEARNRTDSCATSCYACKRSVNKMTSFASGTSCQACLAVCRLNELILTRDVWTHTFLLLLL